MACKALIANGRDGGRLEACGDRAMVGSAYCHRHQRADDVIGMARVGIGPPIAPPVDVQGLARLRHLGVLAARLCGGGEHPAERMVVDGTGRTVALYDGHEQRIVVLDLDDPRWVLDEDGRIRWR